MASFTIYQLHFRSPLRIGERGVGLEVTRPYVPADTLFSAICSAWRELYSADNLKAEILQHFTTDATHYSNAPFFLSSAFPFVGAVRFFPKPIARLNSLHMPEDQGKDFRRVRFVSEAIFTRLISAQPVTFDRRSCCNHDNVWFDCGDASNAAESIEQEALKPFWEPEHNNYEFWRVSVRPRVTLDRVTSASQIWHIGSVHFKPGCGLWFAVAFGAGRNPGIQSKFEACLRLLGDTGLGSERGGGYGLFEFNTSTAHLPAATNAGAFVTLSPCCPSDARELALLTSGEPSFEIITRRGWISSVEGSTLRRKTVWMFGEGSVLCNAESPHPGALVDVKPTIWEGGAIPETQKHSVFRYGYAFPIGFKSDANS